MKQPECYLPDQKVTVVGGLSKDERDKPFVGQVCVIIKRTKSGLYQIALEHDRKVTGSFAKWTLARVPDLIDYRSLFEQAIYHLRVLSGSRNSFHPDLRAWIMHPESPVASYRTPEVERMHREAYEFLKKHDN